MCQLLETIKVRQNRLQNLDYHSDRVNSSRKALFHSTDRWDLSQFITVPDLDPDKTYRCRFLYSRNVEQTEFLPYTPRIIKKLLLIYADQLDYAFKYANREALEAIKQFAAQEQDTDVLIVKNGLITDTSFSNIVFFNGTHWVTPALPLLNGTKRAYYLNKGLLTAQHIAPADLEKFEYARLINAMMDLEESPDIPIRNIYSTPILM